MANRLFNTKLTKTYATVARAEKSVADAGFSELRHVISVDATGRYMAVFIGESALQYGVHSAGFCVAN